MGAEYEDIGNIGEALNYFLKALYIRKHFLSKYHKDIA